jgi:succinoglycan biosynthesis transport protein ExoP
MLQVSQQRPVPDGGTHLSDFGAVSDLLASIVGLIRRRFPIILFLLLVAVLVGVFYLIATPSSFTARSMMIIDSSRRMQAFQQQPAMGEVSVDSATVESQLEILKSENIALAVIKELRLTEDPEFAGSNGGPGGLIFGFFSAPFTSSAEPLSEFQLTRRAIGIFQQRMTVRRIGQSYVIEISFRSFSPDRAAQIANAIATAYIVDQLEGKYQATRRAGSWLQDRIRELREQASSAERAVLKFKAENNIVNVSSGTGVGAGGRLIGEQQLSELNTQLIVARTQKAEAKARLDRIEEITKKDITPGALAGVIRTPDAAVADVLKNEVITKLRSQFLDLANKEGDLSRKLPPTHLALVSIRNQMGEIRKSIFDELRRIAETFKSDYEIATTREQSLQDSLSEIVTQSQTTNQAQVSLRELESAAQTYRALHDNFLQRYMESVQQQSFPITEARVISEASRPLGPSQPNTRLVLAGAVAAGLFLGFGAGLAWDLSDRTFRSERQVQDILHVDCISVLPAVSSAKAAVPLIEDITGFRTEPHPTQDHMSPEGLFQYVIDSPFSRFTEALRSIKVAIDLNNVGKANKVIGVTSTVPNEGKSTVAANLAQLISHAGARVILIDADLRNPSISRILAPQADVGLNDIISGHANLSDAIWPVLSTKLPFIPVVAPSRLSHTNEILASDAMKSTIQALRRAYDYVIVDLPPVAPVVDVRATTNIIDSYIYVIEWGRTKVDVVQHALGSAQAMYDRLLGVVLNKADMEKLGRYAAHGGEYYHNQYYSRYGYLE